MMLAKSLLKKRGLLNEVESTRNIINGPWIKILKLCFLRLLLVAKLWMGVVLGVLLCVCGEPGCPVAWNSVRVRPLPLAPPPPVWAVVCFCVIVAVIVRSARSSSCSVEPPLVREVLKDTLRGKVFIYLLYIPPSYARKDREQPRPTRTVLLKFSRWAVRAAAGWDRNIFPLGFCADGSGKPLTSLFITVNEPASGRQPVGLLSNFMQSAGRPVFTNYII